MKLLRNIFIVLLAGITTVISTGNPISDFYLNDIEVSVYPNPVSEGQITIKSETDIASVEVLNIVGQRIFSRETKPSDNVKLDINGLESGIYLLKITFVDKTFSTKRIWVK
ncbi:MAG: T9SS type A sorting domain-containing protein [Bacteroidales bacterium]|jgi:hypothetical protein